MMKRGYLSVLLCFCFFANAQKVNIVSYTFDDERFALPKFSSVMRSDSTDFGIENGKYSFQNFHQKKGVAKWVNYSFGLNKNANTSYKASVIQLSGPQDYSYGMVVNVENGSNYILFGIASNGYYLIEAVKSGVVTKVSNGWVKSSLIKTGYNAMNDLYIEKAGNEYQFMLNDVKVANSVINLTNFSPKAGIFANSNMKVAFDKLEINQWTNQTVVNGKIGPGYIPSTKLPLASRAYPTASKKSELFGISLGSFDYWYGVIDKDGYRIIDPVFKNANAYGDFVVGGDERQNSVGVYDWQGNIIIPPIMKRINTSVYQGINYFSCRAESGLWGLMDQSGKTVLPFVYSYMDLVSEGYVYMKNSNGWGLADLAGNIKIQAGAIDDEDELSKSSFRLPIRVNKGRIIVKAKASDGGLKGVMDVQGKWVVMPKYYNIDYVDTNQSYIVYLTKPNDKTRLLKGVIDKSGKEIIPVKYSSLYTAGKNYIVAEGDDPEGYDKINDLDDEEEDLFDFLDDMTDIEDNRKWGMISATGNELVPLKFADISTTADDNILLLKQTQSGSKMSVHSLFDQTKKAYLNLSGYDLEMKDSVLLKDKPKKAFIRGNSFYANGLLNVGKAGKWGFIDKTGKIQIPLQFDVAAEFYKGIALVKKNKEWFYIDKTGKRVPETEVQKTYSDKELPPIR